MKKILILLSFLMAINLVFTTHYGQKLKYAEEFVENSSLLEIIENPTEKKCDFWIISFRFISPLIEKEQKFYILKNTENFSSYEQDILLPPPDFLQFFC